MILDVSVNICGHGRLSQSQETQTFISPSVCKLLTSAKASAVMAEKHIIWQDYIMNTYLLLDFYLYHLLLLFIFSVYTLYCLSLFFSLSSSPCCCEERVSSQALIKLSFPSSVCGARGFFTVVFFLGSLSDFCHFQMQLEIFFASLGNKVWSCLIMQGHVHSSDV